MQRGRPILGSTERPSGQYIYNMICKELEQNQLQQKQLNEKLKRYTMRRQRDAVETKLLSLGIEYSLLCKLKDNIENPKYFDEVCDGNIQDSEK